jgi:hypothetical protein
MIQRPVARGQQRRQRLSLRNSARKAVEQKPGGAIRLFKTFLHHVQNKLVRD